MSSAVVSVSRGLQKGGKLSANAFVQYGDQSQEHLRTAWKAALNHGEQTLLEDLRRHTTRKTSYPVDGNQGSDSRTTTFFKDRLPIYSRDGKLAAYAQEDRRIAMAADMIQKTAKEMMKAAAPGVTTTLGFNFIDLRGPALILAPINVPFRNSIPRVGRQNDGYGTAPIWKASRNLGQNYAGASEGNRVATRTPDQITYTMPYKQLGGESAVTTSAEWASEGYSPQLADEHVRGLLGFFLSEEAMDLHGNAGPAAGGYALGTPATPTIVRNTVSSGGFAVSTSVSVCCVYLTAMGNPNNPTNPQYGYLNNLVPGNTVAAGLVGTVIRTNADLSQDVISGGISGVSAMSAVVTCDSTHQTATVTAWTGTNFPKGVFGYAWFVNVTDASAPSRSNAFLAAITQFPSYTVTAVATGTQPASALLVNNTPVDNSFNLLDYTGLIGYAASTPGAYWNDLAGGGLTPDKTGGIVEIDVMLEYLYETFQSNVNAFWVSSDVAKAIDHAVRWGGSNGQPFQFMFNRDQQNNIMGGFVVSTYQSRFAAANPMGGEQIPILIHPMMPKGTLYADIKDLPAGYESSRLPYMRSILTRQDYHSYEWPMVTRTWTFGTYAEQMLQSMMPWSTGVITGISGFSQN